MNKIVYGVIFRNSNKIYCFVSEDEIDIDTEVIVETENGLQYGKIVKKNEEEFKEEYKSILRTATEEDRNIYYDNLKMSEEAVNKAKSLVKELNLDMCIVNAIYNFDRSQLLINFSADERIDFRELAKKLASVYHTRIELRQIGARDKAKQVSGIGVCGFELCCSRFLNQIDTISMNKAKNQGLALNPSKINGSCGRLLCCLNYEDDVYTDFRKGTLPINTIIDYNGQSAKIIGLDVLNRVYKLQIGEDRIDVGVDEINGSKK